MSDVYRTRSARYSMSIPNEILATVGEFLFDAISNATGHTDSGRASRRRRQRAQCTRLVVEAVAGASAASGRERHGWRTHHHYVNDGDIAFNCATYHSPCSTSAKSCVPRACQRYRWPHSSPSFARRTMSSYATQGRDLTDTHKCT